MMYNERVSQLINLSDDLIIVNGVIINVSAQSYGVPPEGGHYNEYIKSASTQKYMNWINLIELNTDNFIPSKSTLDQLITLMLALGFKEYHYDTDLDAHVFQSGSSVMRGFYGILIGNEDASKFIINRENYDYSTEIESGIYYFELR
ncbi:hypothetical protein [Agaribacter flavus]|uniref:Uncharacterized protein n=1 Tax=Agaribacter flavus TaxID=1902781 RepID=A0ABV7FQE5_9ALTE